MEIFNCVCSYCSLLSRSRQHRRDSLCPRRTSNAEGCTCGIQDIGTPLGCRFWSLQQKQFSTPTNGCHVFYLYSRRPLEIPIRLYGFSLLHSLHLLSSSLLSPQSSAPSHTQLLGMQRWLAHSN